MESSKSHRLTLDAINKIPVFSLGQCPFSARSYVVDGTAWTKILETVPPHKALQHQEVALSNQSLQVYTSHDTKLFVNGDERRTRLATHHTAMVSRY